MSRLGYRDIIVVATLCATLAGACGQAGAPASPTSAGSPVRQASEPPTAVPTAGPSVAPAASPPPLRAANGRIAFSEQSNGTGIVHVATVAADGSDHRLLDTSLTYKSEGAEFVPGSDRILFDSDRAGNVHIFSMDSHGRDVRQLTSGDGFEGYPAISPDGTTIAMDTDGLSLMDADGKNQRVMLPKSADGAVNTNPAFSPDGTKIAFERVLDFSGDKGRCAIFVVNVDGSGLVQLTPDWNMEASGPSWSPDGLRIYFGDHRERIGVPKNVWVMNVDGSQLTRLTDEPAGNHAFNAAASPDGTLVALIHYQKGDNHHTLQVMAPDGSHRSVIWTGGAGHYLESLTWGSQP
jgi:TolB protein